MEAIMIRYCGMISSGRKIDPETTIPPKMATPPSVGMLPLCELLLEFLSKRFKCLDILTTAGTANQVNRKATNAPMTADHHHSELSIKLSKNNSMAHVIQNSSRSKL